MNALRVVCKFLLSLVQVLFPRGLKGRHCRSGDPVAGSDSTAIDPAVADGSSPGGHRGDPVDHSSGGSEPEKREPGSHDPELQPPSLTAGNLLGWLLIGAATVKLFC